MSPDEEVPADPARAQGCKVHHITFGLKLKEVVDKLGIEADLRYPGAESKYLSEAEFFKAKLLTPNE